MFDFLRKIFRRKSGKSSQRGTELQSDNIPTERKRIRDIEAVRAALDKNKPVLIYFHSKICPGCRVLSPSIKELGEDYMSRIEFVDYSIDANRDEVNALGITFVPTVLGLDNEGDLRFNRVGVQGGDVELTISNIKSDLKQILTPTGNY